MKTFVHRSIVALALAGAAAATAYSISFAQTTAGPTAALNPQKTEVTLQFPNASATKVTLNAAQVDEAIKALARARAAMNPPRPMVSPAPGTAINVATAGRWYVQPDGEGIDLDVLHPGYGWLGIYMDRTSIEELNRTLARSVHPAAASRRHHSRRE
jgi:hypothetical protein